VVRIPFKKSVNHHWGHKIFVCLVEDRCKIPNSAQTNTKQSCSLNAWLSLGLKVEVRLLAALFQFIVHSKNYQWVKITTGPAAFLPGSCQLWKTNMFGFLNVSFVCGCEYMPECLGDVEGGAGWGARWCWGRGWVSC